MPWNRPFRKLPELPGGIGLSKVTVVLVLAEIVNVWALDVPPPGAALNTATDAVPAVARTVAGMDNVSCNAEPNIVVRFAPFQPTTDEPATKFVPFTVNVNAASPTVADVGLRPVVVGTGFGDAEIVNVWALEVPPPGAALNTVTDAVPAVTRSVAGMDAVSCDAEPNIVVRLAPFHRTTDEPAAKFVPFTVNVNAAPPTGADVGLRLVG